LCAKAPRRIWKAFAPAANAFTVSTFNSIGFAKLKQVFKQRKDSRRRHNAGFGFASGFHLTNSRPAIFFVRIAKAKFPVT
jgi:hypothetical protein